MNVVIIGGGTAGCMAGAHLSHACPSVELHHVFDARRPPIGVGEGTTPIFASWIREVCGVPPELLRRRCDAVPKYGITFEGWGATPRFDHNFYPSSRHAYHISASRLTALLAESIEAKRHDAHVEAVILEPPGGRVCLNDGRELEADFVIDARGFPSADEETVSLGVIPTNAALLRTGLPSPGLTATRAVARPHGWVFVIPLMNRTSYGYVFDATSTALTCVRDDFDRFARNDAVALSDQERLIHFPNFRRRVFFDGFRFCIGNAASFLEPLEATAIGVTIVQIRLAALCLLERLVPPYHTTIEPATVNEQLGTFLDALALFVGWHYSAGSPFDTPFWKHARVRFGAELDRVRASDMGRTFESFVAAGLQLPLEILERVETDADYTRRVAPHLMHKTSFASFGETSFAEVGQGLTGNAA